MKNIALAAFAFVLFSGFGPQGGCGGGLDNRPGEAGIDVGGVYGADWSVSYSDKITVRVLSGGALVHTSTVSAATGGTFTVDGVTVDIAELCARESVTCPQEVFPTQVRMTQPLAEQHLLFVTFNPTGPLAEIDEATLVGNVDSDDDFSIALGIQAAAVGTCGLLGVSYATGRIYGATGAQDYGTSLSGDIVVGYAGGCVVSGSGGSAAAGLSVEFRLPFNAYRQ
jgi:hypothetical protein